MDFHFAHAQLYLCKITPGSINQQSVSGKQSQVKLLNVLPTVSSVHFNKYSGVCLRHLLCAGSCHRSQNIV